MAKFKVWIKIYDRDGVYETEFRDITKYVEKLGDISLDTDSAEYQIGVYRNSNVGIQLDNREGIFSDVGQPTSMFEYKRADSIVKITYEVNNDGPWCGAAIVDDDYLSEDTEVFQGLLNDESALEDVKTEKLSFQLLGRESLFSRTTVPFGLLSNGDLLSDIIFDCLNQTEITNYLSVSMPNIVLDLDQAVDDVSILENKTVKEALDILLFRGNSVLRIKNDAIIVKSRAATVPIQYTFYGQASQAGVENIMDIKNISNGLNRVFNFITWADTTLDVAVNSSIRVNGYKKIEVSNELFTNTVKRLNVLTAIADEFGQKKQELDLVTPLDYSTLDLDLLDRVNIDYPTVTIAWESFPLPICGLAVCGTAVLPKGLWALTIDPAKNFKIIKKTISTSKLSLTYKLREI